MKIIVRVSQCLYIEASCVGPCHISISSTKSGSVGIYIHGVGKSFFSNVLTIDELAGGDEYYCKYVYMLIEHLNKEGYEPESIEWDFSQKEFNGIDFERVGYEFIVKNAVME